MEKQAIQPPETRVEERREEGGPENGQPVDRRAFLQSAVAASVGAGVLGAALLAGPEAAEAAGTTIVDTASTAAALAKALNTRTLVSPPANLSPALIEQ